MDKQEGLSTNKAPRFDGSKYTFQRIRMEVYLLTFGVDIWQLMVNGYMNPETNLVEPADRMLQEYNAKTRNPILYGLEDVEFTKFMQCTSTKKIWDKLKSIYEGDEKVKKVKLQTFSPQFETLQMKEEEDIISYFMQVDDIVNSIIGLGEEVDEYLVVQKEMKSLPLRYDAKVFAIEEVKDWTKLTMDELHRTFIVNEM